MGSRGQPPRAEAAGRAGEHAAPDPVRTRILRGAARVFGERGYGATSVEAILEAAQVSRRTFYRVFRSKEDVLRTLFDNSVQMLVRAVRGSGDRHMRRTERIIASVDAYLRVHAQAGRLARVLLLEQFAPYSPLATQRDRATATFARIIARGAVRAGQPPPDRILVAAMVAAINEVCIQMANEYPRGDWDIERAKRAILRILVALDE